MSLLVQSMTQTTTPGVGGLVYLSMPDGLGGYTDEGSSLQNIFLHLLPRYQVFGSAVGIATKAAWNPNLAQKSVVINGNVDNVPSGGVAILGGLDGTATDAVTIGPDTRCVFGVASIAIGSLCESNGNSCLSIGRSTAGPNFADGNILIGFNCSVAGFDTNSNKINLSNLYFGDHNLQFAGIGERSFTGLTEIGSLSIAGELRTKNPGSGRANLRFGGSVTSAVTFDNTRYWEVMINGVLEKVLLGT